MATQDKLQKSLDALKNLSKNLQPDTIKKKEKIQHCYTITDAISNPTIKISPSFQNLLGSTIQTFLNLCDDPDADIRMTSEECLNRIIRALSDHIGRIQIELHKEIKQNGNAKTLRAALWLFSVMAYQIKPQKGKIYVTNLFPSIMKITERTEESIHETLAVSLLKIMKALGCFTSENEIRVLLKAFLKNIGNTSPVIRRTTVTSILAIILNCKKPSLFITRCLNYLLDILVPVNETQTTHNILGFMLCMKSLLPHISFARDDPDIPSEMITQKLLQVFELCDHYLTHKDHNVVNACLETLNVLLQNSTSEVQKKLLSDKGLGVSKIFNSAIRNRSPSQLSITTNTTMGDESVFSESELTETIHTDIEKWIDESKLSVMNINFAKTISKSQSLEKIDNFLPEDDCHGYGYQKMNELGGEKFVSKLKTHSVGEELEALTISENSSEKSCSEEKAVSEDEAQEIDVGSIYDNHPLLHLIRLICKQFLLTGTPGNYIPDKTVRVSVKHLALTCLSTCFRLCPTGMFVALDKSGGQSESRKTCQAVGDLLLFRGHCDPQLRGAVRMLLGEFARTVSTQGGKDGYEGWIERNAGDRGEAFSVQRLAEIFLEGLTDESSTCIRQTLISLEISLGHLLASKNSSAMLPVLEHLPLLAKNPYWLVKVELCELVSKIDYISVQFVTNSSDFQQKIIYNVLFELLDDSDQRVRTAAGNAIVKIIPQLYFAEYRVREDAVTTKAVLQTENLFECLKESGSDTSVNRKNFIRQMPFPFNEMLQKPCRRIEFSLSKILVKLCNFVLTSTSKHLISGSLETLSYLSKTYPCTVYRHAWCTKDFKKTEDITKETLPDLLKMCVNMFASSTHIYDIQTHMKVLDLTANLYAGNSLALIGPHVDSEFTPLVWAMFSSESFGNLSEQYLTHIVKLLNIFNHVLNELTPLPPQSKTILPSLPPAANLSPIKRRKSDLDKKMLTTLKSEKDERNERRDGMKSTLGSFVQSSHYMRVFEGLKGAFMNYKMSLDTESSHTFVDLMVATLRNISVLMEVGSLTEFSRVSEDILSYFRSTFTVKPSATVEGVQQLLKCLFGTNLAANIAELSTNRKEDDEIVEGFHYNVYHKPYSFVTQHVYLLDNISRFGLDDDSTVMGYLHRKDVKRRSVILTKSSDKILATYIRIFEPMVIKSLRQYTITSDVELQCQVLQLLSQLVQLRVNYCLLDSDQVFINFVLKQFEYIEEGQIPHSDELIPKIFQFLVQLSYSKQHSKCIISVPKIIQLCDGLMASGQPAATHCIPALEPIVDDIFLTRNKSNTTDMKELETTREVVLSMLLRLTGHKQVMDLITLILEDSKYCIDNTEKWQDWSTRVFSVLLPLLKQNKLKMSNPEEFVALKGLIMALNPEVFHPFDEITVTFFQEPPRDADISVFNSWLAKVQILLNVLSPLKEDTLLSKIEKLKSEFSPASIFENVTTKADPLNVNNNAETFQNIRAEFIFVRFLLRIISLSAKKCFEVIQNQEGGFLMQQVSAFLMHSLYIFQSGNHLKITKTAIRTLMENTPRDQQNIVQVNEISEIFLSLSNFYPVLSCQWCCVLASVNYFDEKLNSMVFEDDPKDARVRTKKSIDSEIVKAGAAICFCDYLTENSTETNLAVQFLKGNSKLLVMLYEEPPAQEFISFVHRDAVLSKLFIEELSRQICDIDPLVDKMRFLRSIENCHSSQIGAVLKLLVPKILNFHQAVVSRLAANMASRKVEILLTLSPEEVKQLLSKEDLERIQKSLIDLKLVRRHEALVSLLNKLTQFYKLPPIEFEQRRTVNAEHIKTLKINKKWYLSQIQARYDDVNVADETAELLSKLEYNEIISFMSSSSFNKSCLKDCLRLGLEMNRKDDESDIAKASVDCVVKDVTSIVSRIGQAQQVFSTPVSNQLHPLFENEDFSSLLRSIAQCIPLLLDCSCAKSKKFTINNWEEFLIFGAICLEYISYLHKSRKTITKVHTVDIFLSAAHSIFKESFVCDLLSDEGKKSWYCSSVTSIYNLVEILLRNDVPLPSIPNYLKELTQSTDNSTLIDSCHNLYTLVTWIYHQKGVNKTNIPEFLFEKLKRLVISFSRASLGNSYVLLPSTAWKTGWRPENVNLTQVGVLPMEVLQEIDVLEEFIFRITLLGWTSRQQFEETWMCLLSVLCRPTTEELDSIEFNEAAHTSALAIKAISSLLLQTLTCSQAGNPNVFKCVHVSRNEEIPNENICIKKLKVVQDCMQSKCENSCDLCNKKYTLNIFNPRNFEKLSHKYGYGQVSVKYFLIVTGSKDSEDYCIASEVYRSRKKMLEESGLDINSCLQFLIDYFTQLMKPQAKTHIMVLHEAIRSTLIISDLFMDKAQFSWLLDVFLELSKLHTVEDELLHQYLITGICKAVAVLSPELEVYEQVKKMLTLYLKSPYLSSRIASLYGLLYILEGCKLSNITIGGMSEEMQVIVPLAVEYVQFNLNVNNVLKKSQEHSSLVWSLAFYLLENVDERNLDQNFVATTISTAFSILAGSSDLLHVAIIKGLERLLVVKSTNYLEKFGKQYSKLALEMMKHDNPSIALLGTQLLLSYMYTDCTNQLQSSQSLTNAQVNPDQLVQTIEKMSSIFERIKKGYVYEVEILCSVLPIVLEDFFSPSDILTKVIGEFLSSQQPHPKLLSRVVFQLFQSAILKDQLPLLQDWVVFSLSNFTQSFSIGMATWCLTCFFLSASANPWLRSYFPYVQTRVGRQKPKHRGTTAA
ncbi:unnamed protein product [Acanthoscelides obtectus]|uniref:Huntingtin n=1 Tax=Acanthoscelides obtectus TaxID=200917 RepID=A0A9P0PKY4_ACAOB|nr:unnamed protein product [Acanthoscelides obtectus]CAK1626724.1 Huntingtin [Acanthoscelides obtectus]